MPQALIPILIGVATAAPGIVGLFNRPGAPKIPTAAPASPAGPTAEQARAAITPQALTIESLTGGSISPEYLATIAPTLAGVGTGPNVSSGLQQALQDILGTRGGTATAGGGGTSAAPTAPFTPSTLPVNLGALAATPGLSNYLANLAGTVA